MTCDGASGWRCHYDCDQVDCEGADDTQIAALETACDGVDNNCDGATDEGFQLWGDASTFDATCDNGGVGRCHGQGTVKCGDDGTSYVCCGVSTGTVCASGNVVAETIAPIAEAATPNGVDEDCDGFVDDGATGCAETVSITGPTGSYEVFRYEASRASELSGAVCSTDDVTPWTNLTFEDARHACLLMNASDSGCSYETPEGNGESCWDLCGASRRQCVGKPGLESRSGIGQPVGVVEDQYERCPIRGVPE